MRMITAIIPAHNEADAIEATIASLRAQTVVPDHILVISDNSSDETVSVAQDLGVEIFETQGNTARKAGALNQALTRLGLSSSEIFIVMDADTQLSNTFIERALIELEDPSVGAVGAVFRGERPTSYLELCTYLEWCRYAEETDRTKKTFVLSGTAALIRSEALRDVYQMFGRVYDEGTITEDSRMSIDLKSCGWILRSPVECSATTEMMPTVKMLFLQRRRWYLGAMQNVSDAGFNKVTRPYWGQQAMLGLSVILMWTLILCTLIAVLINGGIEAPQPFWLAVGFIFVIERVVTVWDEPISYRIFAALVLPELIFALILQVAYVAAVAQKVTGSTGTWAHLTTKEA